MRITKGSSLRSRTAIICSLPILALACGDNVQYVGYGTYRTADADVVTEVRPHSNILYLNADPQEPDFDTFSAAGLGSGMRLVVSANLYCAHFEASDFQTLVSQRLERIRRFLVGEFTNGAALWSRTVAVVLVDEPTTYECRVRLEDLEQVVSMARLSLGRTPLMNVYFFPMGGTDPVHEDVPADMQYVGIDPYVTRNANESMAAWKARVEQEVRKRLEAAIAKGLPVFVFPKSFGAQVVPTSACPGGCSKDGCSGVGVADGFVSTDANHPCGTATVFMNAETIPDDDQHQWYYDLAKSYPQIVGLVWSYVYRQEAYHCEAPCACCLRDVSSAVRDTPAKPGHVTANDRQRAIGAAILGKASGCEDGDVCTSDSFVAGTGCTHAVDASLPKCVSAWFPATKSLLY